MSNDSDDSIIITPAHNPYPENQIAIYQFSEIMRISPPQSDLWSHPCSQHKLLKYFKPKSLSRKTKDKSLL